MSLLGTYILLNKPSSQCSCLENPRDRGAWWAAVSGVAQSWTRLSEFHYYHYGLFWGFPNDLSSNESACHTGDTSMGYMLPVILNINNSIN